MNPADTVNLGRTSLRVSRLGLGGGPLAGLFQEVTEAQAAGTIDRALEQGVRLFDTAPLYGHGLSEQRIGGALRSRKRDTFVLATKAGRLLLPLANGEDVQSNFARPLRYRPVFDFTWDGVMRSFESSLKRLNVDRIDIIYVHDPDDYFDDVAKGAYPALDSLRSQHVVGAIGAAMNHWELLLRFASLYDFDCFLLASRYTLLDQSALDEFLPVCVSKGIGVIVGAPFNSGILATGARPDAIFEYSQAQPEVIQKVRRIEDVC
jgi:D-threo-aldose 1-dehydrogenase